MELATWERAVPGIRLATKWLADPVLHESLQSALSLPCQEHYQARTRACAGRAGGGRASPQPRPRPRTGSLSAQPSLLIAEAHGQAARQAPVQLTARHRGEARPAGEGSPRLYPTAGRPTSHGWWCPTCGVASWHRRARRRAPRSLPSPRPCRDRERLAAGAGGGAGRLRTAGRRGGPGQGRLARQPEARGQEQWPAARAAGLRSAPPAAGRLLDLDGTFEALHALLAGNPAGLSCCATS